VMDLRACRSVQCYEKIELRGEGTYGQVFMARERDTSHVYALKRVRMEKEKEGFPVTALRELTILKSLLHPNIVDLREVVVGTKQESVFLVFEFCEYDMAALLDSSSTPPFTEAEIKRLMLQLLDGVAYMHEHWVLHRDLKMSNLLYHQGTLKICDFGLAREFGTPLKPYTPKVVTLWYRAPEVLLGAKAYSSALDIWSCGCIFGELVANDPILPGRSEVDQLTLIYDLLGAPSEAIWPGYSSLPGLASLRLPNQPYNNIQQRFPGLSAAGRDFLNKMLTYDPDKRPTARKLLQHDCFLEQPLPKPPESMPHLSRDTVMAKPRKRKRDEEEGGVNPKPRKQDDDDRFGRVF